MVIKNSSSQKNESEEINQNTGVPGKWTLLVISFLIFDVWLLNLVVGLSPDFLGGRGTFGDTFGVSNSLFSGLALAGLVYAVLLQRAEIRMQRRVMGIAQEELRQTKAIFEKQSQSLALQNDETKKQLFETTYFQLLRVFTDLTSNLDIIGQNDAHGKDVFTTFEADLTRIEHRLISRNKAYMYTDVFDALYSLRQGDLGHYFRTLYNILKFVDRSVTEDKKFYTNILRAQLSNSELHLLLYNGLSKNGRDKLKPLLERYEFFDNLPVANVRYEDALHQYDRRAFGSNDEILDKI